MALFTFSLPTKVVLGLGSIKELGSETRRLGAGDVLVTMDKAIERAGLVDKIQEILETESLTVTVYNQVSSPPTPDSMRSVIDFVREAKYDVVVGLGGGSSMDSAKMAAAGATNKGDPMEYASPPVPSKRQLEHSRLPLITVPTVAGGTAESSPFIVFYHSGETLVITDEMLYPDVAILDPEMTLTCPPGVTAGNGFDCLSCGIEPMLSNVQNRLRDSLALETARLVSTNLRTACHQGSNIEARFNMCLASFMGTLSAHTCNRSSTWPAHSFAEVLGAKYEVPHGLAVGLVLPYVMKYLEPGCIGNLAQIASAMGERVHGLSAREAASRSVTAVKQLAADVNVPKSLKEFGVPKDSLGELADEVMMHMMFFGEISTLPRALAEQEINRISSAIWSGDIDILS